MSKIASITENEKSQQDLLSLIKSNNQDLGALQEQYKVYIDKNDGSSGFFDFTKIDAQANKLISERDWDKKLTIYHEIAAKIPRFAKNYQQYRDVLLTNAKASDDDKKNFEISTRQYHKMLEVVNNSLVQLVDSLGAHNRTTKSSFQERLTTCTSENSTICNEIKQFNQDLSDFSNKIADIQVKNPDKKMAVSLKSAISNVQSMYASSYDAYGLKGTFWRWIKEIFQNTDRAKEINFLQKLSESAGCTETIRHQAMLLVSSKIKSVERYGIGSKLGSTLDNLTQGKLAEEINEHSNLVDFLTTNPALKKLMPKALSNYFEKNKENYANKAPVEETATASLAP